MSSLNCSRYYCSQIGLLLFAEKRYPDEPCYCPWPEDLVCGGGDIELENNNKDFVII